MTTRSEPSEPFDLVVVGGGITGAGIARDAALRGLRVALLEKRDYAAGTSSKSSKLVHGGLRYLEHGEIGLVFESVSERRVQGRVAPHLVQPLPFLVAIYEGSKPGLELMNVGLWIYDTLALFRSPRLHRTFRGDRAREIEPKLRPEGLRGALEYHDCITDDARLVLENVLDACELGADCRSHTEMTSVDRDRRGRVRAVRTRDCLTGEELSIPARSVILATGPWTDEAADRARLERSQPILRPTKGVHLVFPREKLPLERAITMISPIDGRVMFAIPWRDRTVLGTTDTDFHGSPDDVYAEARDVRYLCDSANGFFPDAGFRPEDVIATWAGLRPLVDDRAASESDVSREHQVFVDESGVVAIAGGKLTTYRIMARDAVDAAVRWLRDTGSDVFESREIRRIDTKKRPLPGARDLEEPGPEALRALAAELAGGDLDEDTARHLAGVYGVRARELAAIIADDPALGHRLDPELPFVWAEIAFAVTRDRARTLDDVLARRVPLLLVSRDQALGVAPLVAELMATLRGWTAEETEAEIRAYTTEVERSRRFRAG